MARYPELEIEISFADRLVDLAQEGFDVAVRIGPLPDTDRLSARRLGEQAVGLAASPAYLQRVGPIECIEDLAGHRGIAYRSSTPHRNRVASPLMMDDLQAVADAAIAGVGLAWLPSWLIAHVCAAWEVGRSIARLSRATCAHPCDLAHGHAYAGQDTVCNRCIGRSHPPVAWRAVRTGGSGRACY